MHELNKAMNILLQQYRHEFVNVLQVVGGLAQLQKPDKLLAYIHKVSEELQQFGHFIGCGDARLALIVFETLLQNLQGCYVLQVKGNMPLLTSQTLQGLKPTLLAAMDCLQGLQDLSVSICLEGGEQPMLHLRLWEQSAVTWQPVLQIAIQNGLQAVVNPQNDEFSIRLDKDELLGEK